MESPYPVVTQSRVRMKPELLVLVAVTVISSTLLVGGVMWAKAGGGRPMKWMPRAPSYAFTCLFGAAWNAIVVRSLPATVFCVALAGLFKLGEDWSHRRQTWTVVGVIVGLAVMVQAWVLSGMSR